ncbi:hypothetical protein BJF79_25710 [Actinomadura sp. CNU-125]|nr:hypothetical protein BJF79_25710 [Actinomadura sp. CNU-125]
MFNGMIDRRPALIVRCASPSDVARGIAHARERGLPLSVRAGGHGVTGDAVLDGAVCLDLRPMNAITVDPGRGARSSRPGRTGASSTPPPRSTAWP